MKDETHWDTVGHSSPRFQSTPIHPNVWQTSSQKGLSRNVKNTCPGSLYLLSISQIQAPGLLFRLQGQGCFQVLQPLLPLRSRPFPLPPLSLPPLPAKMCLVVAVPTHFITAGLAIKKHRRYASCGNWIVLDLFIELNISMALPPIPKCHDMSIHVHQTLLVSKNIPKQSQKTCSDSVHTRLQVGTDLILFFFHFVHGGAFRLCFHSLVNLFWELCCSLLCKCVLVCLVLPEQTQNWLLHMAYRCICYQILPEHTAAMIVSTTFDDVWCVLELYRTVYRYHIMLST